jgi:hypothetical protein
LSKDWETRKNKEQESKTSELFMTFLEKFRQNSDFRATTYGILTALFLLNYIYFALQEPQLPKNTNRIMLSGEPLKEDKVLSVTHYSAFPSTVEGVLEARLKKVNEQSDLLKSPYRISAVVFHKLDLNAPWVGLEGITNQGKFTALKSPDDIAYESRMLLNPFLFIEPFFVDFSSLEGSSLLNSNTAFSPDVQPKIQEIFFSKNRDEHKIIINMSEFYKDAIERNLIIGKPSDLVFSTSAYNARDFGFNSIQFLSDKSSNVFATTGSSELTKIKEQVEFQDSICIESSGCNGRSRESNIAPRYTVKALPAIAVFELSRRGENGEVLFKLRSSIKML